jgi:hypothetical protein
MRDRGPQNKNSGVFKKARPARPQALGRVERTDEYVSTAKGVRTRLAAFFNTPYVELWHDRVGQGALPGP